MPNPYALRPYRVGMTREPQRFVEPDEIYEDLRVGQRMEMPRQFPYSWTPVNGYSSVGATGDLFSSVTNLFQGTIDDAAGAIEGRVAQGVQDFINSTPGKKFLEAVENKAAEGVTDVVKKNGLDLIILGVAAGAVGGTLSAKLGKAGTVLALLAGGFAVFRLMNAVAPASQVTKKRK